MRREEKRRGGVKESRPDGLVCREKGIAAGACGVRQEKERSTELERERLRRDLAPAETMEGIVFLFLKAEGQPCGGKRSHELDLTIK